MTVETLTLKNFRNISFEKIYFKKGINLLVGKNAQGKTNMLEAVSFCSYLKSFRAAKEEQLIKFGCDSAEIKLEYSDNGEKGIIEIVIHKNAPKELRHNGLAVTKNRELVGRFLSIIFTPDHLDLIKEGPNKRRAFLDMALCAIDVKYTDTLLRYQKITAQRNALLKKDPSSAGFFELLSVYDEKLSEEGAYIALRRAEYIRSLEPFAREIYSDISRTDNKLKLLYINQFAKEVTDIEEIKKAIKRRLTNVRQIDLTLQMTTSGIQKDDLLILQSGKSLKFFGSQGQIRSAVLSMILAQGAVINERYGVYPVIILDDILSELDRTRQKYILTETPAAQCLLSTCDSAKAKGKGNIIKVSEGRVI